LVAGSILHGLGLWVNKQLQQIINKINFVTRSTQTLIHELKALPPQGKHTKLFTDDAKSIYTNIEASHALETIAASFNEREFEGKYL
jgi:hypothetical protein